RAEGSMRDAESLLDQCMSAAEGKIDIELVRRVLGLVDSQMIMELLGSVSRRDRKESLEIVDRVVSSGLDLEEFFLAYIEGLRNLLVLSVGESIDWLDLGRSEIEELGRIGRAFRTEEILFLFRSATRSFREFKGSSQPRYHLEASIAEAASWESAVELTKLLRKLDGLNGSVKGEKRKRGPVPPSSSSDMGVGNTDGESGTSGKGIAGSGRVESRSARTADTVVDTGSSPGGSTAVLPSEGAFARIERPSTVTVATDGLPVKGVFKDLGGKEQWERFLAHIRETKLTLGIWLMSAEVRGVKDDKLVLAFSPQSRFAREMIREEKNKRYIESHLERFFGRKLIIETGESWGPEPKVKRPEKRKMPAPDPQLAVLVKDAPMVGRLIEEFDGVLSLEDQQ
ncbi:MAG: hypothetical protein KAX38_06000, partial [Candidatus Krumholzibacteria bacterium]|nr:hypothetical protein [Candidatus Krumholzibacteria bacterium]